MVYIKGVNDKEYAKFLASQPKPTEQVMRFSLVKTVLIYSNLRMMKRKNQHWL